VPSAAAAEQAIDREERGGAIDEGEQRAEALADHRERLASCPIRASAPSAASTARSHSAGNALHWACSPASVIGMLGSPAILRRNHCVAVQAERGGLRGQSCDKALCRLEALQRERPRPTSYGRTWVMRVERAAYRGGCRACQNLQKERYA
jgi:hypothetical protein